MGEYGNKSILNQLTFIYIYIYTRILIHFNLTNNGNSSDCKARYGHTFSYVIISEYGI